MNSGLPNPRVHGIGTVLCFLSMTPRMTQGKPQRAKKGPAELSKVLAENWHQRVSFKGVAELTFYSAPQVK